MCSVRALDHIEKHLCDNWLSPVTIAADLNVSRAHLYRVFREDGGVAALIRRRRLELAYVWLTDPDQASASIERIGLQLGFGSVTQFARAFRHHYGVPPGRARAEGRRLQPASPLSRYLDRLAKLYGATAGV